MAVELICQDCGEPFMARDRRGVYCELCRDDPQKKLERQRAYVKNHRDKDRDAYNAAARDRRRKRMSDPEYRASENERWREYYYSHDEYRDRHIEQKVSANRELQRSRDPEYLAQQAQYQRTYREKNRTELNQKKRARVLSIPKPDNETVAYMEILRGDPCSYCAEDGGYVDHVTPVSKDGLNHWTNLTGACFGCNSSKKDRTDLLVWMLDQKQRKEGRPSTIAAA